MREGGLINGVIIKLRTAWAYKRGAYTWGAYIRGFAVYQKALEKS